PVAIGFVLMVMVYAGGHVSGGHYNPPVSLGAALRGALLTKELVPYWVGQLLVAVGAAAVARWVAGAFTVAPGPDAGALAALTVETLFAFALVAVVLASATAAATKGNSFYGLGIGGTVLAAAFAGGGISGGALQPAVCGGAVVVDDL